jgi:beta-glucosidase
MIGRRSFLFASCASMAFWPGFAQTFSVEKRCPDKCYSARILYLLSQMTIDEKIGQLTLYPDEVRPTPRPINPEINAQAEALIRAEYQFAEIREGKVGALLGGTGVELGRKLQEAALHSRMRIPLMFGADVLHGFRTIFPIPLALASSFEPKLAEQTARAAAEEMTAVGVHWTYAPMVDVARDQRWGRVAEGSGEDTFLTSRFAEAYVHGFQGKDLSSSNAVAACPKHFAGYGAVIGGMEYNATDLTERELRQTHLPPFKAALDAGALTIMAAFNDVDGVPASGNRRLFTDILRDEWRYSGFVVSDAASIEELVAHGFARDENDAARLALGAGVDMNMGGGLYKRNVASLIKTGGITLEQLDEAVARVLNVKEKLGLFDDPFRSLDPIKEKRNLRSPSALALARRAAVRSVVLLKNKDNVLPFPAGARIALIGPFGDDLTNLDGAWAPWAKVGEGVTLAQGLREELGSEYLSVVKGSEIDGPIADGIGHAIAAASAADLVVLAIGESQKMSGEAASRTQIIVPPAQQALADAVLSVGKPVIAVISCGRALALQGAVRDADAILVNWFLGSEGGRALADVLTGRESPSGRLPVSFPQDPGQQPWFYNHKSTGRPQQVGENSFFKARYREVSNEALYPFGHGLGYSTVEYGPTEVSRPHMSPHEIQQITALVKNTGTRAIEEVVQLYVRDVAASVTRPVRELKAFKKISLAPGMVSRVTFEINRADLEFVGRDLNWRIESGEFEVWIAPSSVQGISTRFDLVGLNG